MEGLLFFQAEGQWQVWTPSIQDDGTAGGFNVEQGAMIQTIPVPSEVFRPVEVLFNPFTVSVETEAESDLAVIAFPFLDDRIPSRLPVPDLSRPPRF